MLSVILIYHTQVEPQALEYNKTETFNKPLFQKLCTSNIGILGHGALDDDATTSDGYNQISSKDVNDDNDNDNIHHKEKNKEKEECMMQIKVLLYAISC